MDKKKYVYVARFVAMRTEETFIKVGISSYHLERRFQADLGNFDVTLIRNSAAYAPRDALIVEYNIHQLLHGHRYSPFSRLRSGNTECFKDNEVVVAIIDRALIPFPGKTRKQLREEELAATQAKRRSGYRTTQTSADRRIQHDTVMGRWVTDSVARARQRETEQLERMTRQERREQFKANRPDEGWGSKPFRYFG